jgi:hypothetical protein
MELLCTSLQALSRPIREMIKVLFHTTLSPPGYSDRGKQMERSIYIKMGLFALNNIIFLQSIRVHIHSFIHSFVSFSHSFSFQFLLRSIVRIITIAYNRLVQLRNNVFSKHHLVPVASGISLPRRRRCLSCRLRRGRFNHYLRSSSSTNSHSDFDYLSRTAIV